MTKEEKELVVKYGTLGLVLVSLVLSLFFLVINKGKTEIDRIVIDSYDKNKVVLDETHSFIDPGVIAKEVNRRIRPSYDDLRDPFRAGAYVGEVLVGQFDDLIEEILSEEGQADAWLEEIRRGEGRGPGDLILGEDNRVQSPKGEVLPDGDVAAYRTQPVDTAAIAEALDDEERADYFALINDFSDFKDGETVDLSVLDALPNQYARDFQDTGDPVQDLITYVAQFAPVAKEKGLYPSVMIAQALLESADGTSGLARDNNNLYGIKGTYEGEGSAWATNEHTSSGQTYQINATFRAYPSWEVSVIDYLELLEGRRYSGQYGVNQARSPEEAVERIQAAGYATDTSYITKILQLIDRHNLKQYD